MYVGHELLALALAAGLARIAGVTRRRALVLGGLGGVYAFAPDLDLAYTVWAVLEAGPARIFPTTEHVWTESWIVHRSLTHSLVTGIIGVITIGLFGATLIRYRTAGFNSATGVGIAATAGAIGALGWIVVLSDELLGLLTIALYVSFLLATTAWGIGRAIPPRQLMGVAAVGLWTHPFGDVFTGRPPAFLYPFYTTPSIEKIVIVSEPTVNLIALFLLELLIAWIALLTIFSVAEYRLRTYMRRRAILGLGFAGTVPFIQPPTLDIAYHFALGTIATGAVLGAISLDWHPYDGIATSFPERGLTALVTALAGATLAVVGYLGAYLLVGSP